MIDQEERQEIIDAAVEKALLLIPEVVGNLITNQVIFSKLSEEFYKDHPEFRSVKHIVTSVIEMIEGRDPLAKYEDILKASVPEIRKRIEIEKSLDMKEVPKNPNRNFESDFQGEL